MLKYPHIKQFFTLDPLLNNFENTLKREVIEINWRCLQREFGKFGIILAKSIADRILEGNEKEMRDFVKFLVEFERTGGTVRIAHTVLIAASMPIIPIIGKEY